MDDEKLICPYCGREQETHEPDVISALCCLTTCEHCDREFWYAVDVKHLYVSYRNEE